MRANEFFDDIAPKEKVGFIAKLDQKRTASDHIHGAARDKEANKVIL